MSEGGREGRGGGARGNSGSLAGLLEGTREEDLGGV